MKWITKVTATKVIQTTLIHTAMGMCGRRIHISTHNGNSTQVKASNKSFTPTKTDSHHTQTALSPSVLKERFSGAALMAAPLVTPRSVEAPQFKQSLATLSRAVLSVFIGVTGGQYYICWPYLICTSQTI